MGACIQINGHTPGAQVDCVAKKEVGHPASQGLGQVAELDPVVGINIVST